MHLSSLSQGGRQAAECEDFFRCIGKREQGLLDLLRQGLKRRNVVQGGVLLFALLPELLQRVVVRRIGRQLDDVPPGRRLGEAGFGLGAGRLLRPILHEDDGVGGVRQDTREQGPGGGRVAATGRPLRKAGPRAGVEQAEDCRALALATRLDCGVLAAPRPGRRERAPRRERRGIAQQPQGLPLLGTAQYLGPRRGAPRLPFGFITRSGDQGGLWKAKAHVLQQLGAGEDGGEDAEAVVNPRLEHGRTPAGAAAPHRDRPRVTAGGESGLRRRGEWGAYKGRLLEK
jgi:hypothetical protein